MTYKVRNEPLFLGLTHVGQVFSIGWSERIGKCAVYDFQNQAIKKFKNYQVTNEEPSLKKYLKRNYKKIYFCKNAEEIKKYNTIFLTIDTPLTLEGKPKIDKIIAILKKAANYLRKNCNLIITSQVYCGFCDELKKTIFKKRPDINLIYLAETLIMGKALERFMKPERIILGFNRKVKFLNQFKKFNCQVFQLSLKEAEMVKIAINLFLFTSVTYANVMDYYCRQFGFKFSRINQALRYDQRIGKKSYISPSLGISGGHLERDVHTIIKTSKNPKVKSLFKNLKQVNETRLSLLIKEYQNLKKKFKFKKVIWIGPSYKSNSFSVVNSPFVKFKKYLKIKRKTLYSFDSFFDLKKEKINNFLKNLNRITLNKSLLIFNYASTEDQKKIRVFFDKGNCKIISLNSVNKKYKNLF
tara:strand:+ start:1005 stop:2240 length:1236 start_codon:yes stop_codon:yes gene_type:complete